MKWFFTSFRINPRGRWWILPLVSFAYDEWFPLETGVSSKAFIFEIKWLKWGWCAILQQGY